MKASGIAVFVSILGLASMACAGAAAPSGEQPAPATQQPKRGGVFHIPVAGTNPNLNPYVVSGSATTMTDTIYERLVARDASPGVNWYGGDQKMKPALAERWERSDENTYTFHLRKDVKWHDGQPFTAEDVLHTFNYLRTTPGMGDTARVKNVKTLEAVDAHTLRLVTGLPNPDFLKDDLVHIEIIPNHLAAQGKQIETSAVGTGAFKLKQFDKTSGWTVVRNDDYWVKGLPYLDGITGHYLSDRGAMTAAIASGNIDVMVATDRPQLDSMVAIKNDVRYEKAYGPMGYGLIMAMDRPPFDDIRVRRAMNLALDRQEMVVTGAFGDGVVNPPGAAGWTSAALPQEQLFKMPGYNPTTRQQDLAQAKDLLAQAGNPRIAAKISYSPDNTGHGPIAEVAAAQFKEKLGMDITLQPLDRASTAKMETEGTYEMRVVGAAGGNSGRSGMHEVFHSKGAVNKRGPFDPELDALMDKYRAEFDEAQVQRLHQQVQRLLYDKAYVLGGMERALYVIYQPWLHDVLSNYAGNIVPWYTPPALWIDVDMLPGNRRNEKP